MITKAELIKALEPFPDDVEISIRTYENEDPLCADFEIIELDGEKIPCLRWGWIDE